MLVDIHRTSSAGLTASEPTTGSSPSGSTHGTASVRRRRLGLVAPAAARAERGGGEEREQEDGPAGYQPRPPRRFVVYSCVCGFSRGRIVDGITRWSSTVHVSRPRVMSDW